MKGNDEPIAGRDGQRDAFLAVPLTGTKGNLVNFNNARLALVFTARKGGPIEDDTPNGELNTGLSEFDVVVQIERGGGVSGEYTLALVAHDISDGTIVPGYGFTITDSFNGAQWTATGTDAFTQTRKTITVDPNRSRHVLRYTAVLVSENFQITSFADSNYFIQQ